MKIYDNPINEGCNGQMDIALGYMIQEVGSRVDTLKQYYVDSITIEDACGMLDEMEKAGLSVHFITDLPISSWIESAGLQGCSASIDWPVATIGLDAIVLQANCMDAVVTQHVMDYEKSLANGFKLFILNDRDKMTDYRFTGGLKKGLPVYEGFDRDKYFNWVGNLSTRALSDIIFQFGKSRHLADIKEAIQKFIQDALNDAVLDDSRNSIIGGYMYFSMEDGSLYSKPPYFAKMHLKSAVMDCIKGYLGSTMYEIAKGYLNLVVLPDGAMEGGFSFHWFDDLDSMYKFIVKM